jgi:hypothetical protein
MEKKQYIMPSVRVKAVNMLLMQPASTPNGDDPITDPDDELSKEVDMPSTHDVWED